MWNSGGASLLRWENRKDSKLVRNDGLKAIARYSLEKNPLAALKTSQTERQQKGIEID